MQILHIATIALGCVSLSLSLLLFLYFRRSSQPIGRAVAFMLLGETVGAAATVIFALTANGLYDVLGDGGSTVLRWVIFTSAILTSVHLAYQTRLVELDAMAKDASNADD